MTLEQGIKIYEEKNPEHMISSILDVGDEWVIAAKDKESGLERDASPIAIHKETGNMRVFFPPFNVEKLRNAIPVDLNHVEYERDREDK